MEYRYYKGEAESPFDQEREYAKWLFWVGEMYYSQWAANSDDFHQDNLNRYREWRKDHMDEIRGIMGEPNACEDMKAMVLFLDEWHQKWFPYDEGDIIFEY